jgi:hypothetical protein
VQLVKKMERDIYEEGKKNKSFQVSEWVSECNLLVSDRLFMV